MKINKSAARTIDVLELLAKSSKPLSQIEISQSLQIPKTSVFELIYTLLEKEMVEYGSDEKKSFKLSVKSFEIGASVIRKANFHKISRPFMERLSHKVGETVFLGIEDKGDIVYFDRVDVSDNFATTVSLGTRRPMYCTALGKAFLAGYSDKALTTMFDGYNFVKRAENTISGIEELQKELQHVRERGYALDYREVDNEICCVSAPLYDWTDKIVAAISISGLYVKMDKKRLAELGNLLVETAMEISKQLGYSKNKFY